MKAIESFLQFASNNDSDEFRGITSDGRFYTIKRILLMNIVTAYYANIEDSFPITPVYRLIAIQTDKCIKLIEGINAQKIFDSQDTPAFYHNSSYLNLFGIIDFAHSAIHTKDRSVYRYPLPNPSRGLPMFAPGIDIDIWRLVFNPNFESELETRIHKELLDIQTADFNKFNSSIDALPESLPYWDRQLIERILASALEPEFPHYRLSDEKDDYIAVLRQELESIKRQPNHPLNHYLKIIPALKQHQSVTIDFFDNAGIRRTIDVSNNAFSIMEKGEWQGKQTMLMPLQNVALDSDKVEQVRMYLFAKKSSLYPSVNSWLPWCRIINIRDGNRILWMNHEVDFSENNAAGN